MSSPEWEGGRPWCGRSAEDEPPGWTGDHYLKRDGPRVAVGVRGRSGDVEDLPRLQSAPADLAFEQVLERPGVLGTRKANGDGP
jgi:hypothetical protein